MKFENEADADQQFKLAKHDELVAIHYDRRFREVQRFQSHRVKSVMWHHLADWCKEDHQVETPSKVSLEAGVSATGKVEDFTEQSKPASLMASAPTSAIRASSNLVGKVGMLEAELTQLGSKATGLLASIGVDNLAGQALGGSGGKLKSRVGELERYLAGMFKNTKALEEELLGITGASAISSSGQSSIKAKVDSMVASVDNLKKRFIALDASPVISQLPEVEKRIASYSSKVAGVLKDCGLPAGTSPAFRASQDGKLKSRIESLENAIADEQRNTNTLGYELLERSWTSLDQQLSATQKEKGSKARVESLVPLADELQRRMVELDSAPLKSDIAKIEDKIPSLQTKAEDLSKRIGAEAPSMLEAQVPQDTSTLKARLLRLEKLASLADAKFGHLEVELLGSAKSLPENLENVQSMNGHVKSLQAKVDALASRAAALEQDV